MDVVCPDRWRMVTKGPNGRPIELLRIGQTGFLREGGGPWTEVTPDTGLGSPCFDDRVELDPAGVYGGQADVVAQLLAVGRHASLSRVKPGQAGADGSTCQEWRTLLPPSAGMTRPWVSVCLSPADALPRRIMLLDGEDPWLTGLFYDWNQPIRIDRPGSMA